MPEVLVIALALWVGCSCLIAIALVRVGALADQREDALRRKAARPDGRRRFAPAEEHPVLTEVQHEPAETSFK